MPNKFTDRGGNERLAFTSDEVVAIGVVRDLALNVRHVVEDYSDTEANELNTALDHLLDVVSDWRGKTVPVREEDQDERKDRNWIESVRKLSDKVKHTRPGSYSTVLEEAIKHLEAVADSLEEAQDS